MIPRLAARLRILLDLLAPLGPGSRALMLRIVAALGWKGALIAATVTVYAAARYRTWIAWGVIAWCAAAWAHAPATVKEPVEDAEPEPEPPPAGPDPADVADLVRDVIGTDRGALLTALVGPLSAASTKAVREALAAAGIRVREGVRTTAGNGPGVHRDDVPTPPPPPTDAPVGVVVADQRANTNANNAPTSVSREGMTIITDPADHHRTVSLRKT